MIFTVEKDTGNNNISDDESDRNTMNKMDLNEKVNLIKS